MGQKEVMEVLKDRKWHTKKEIMGVIGFLSVGSANESLRRLVRGDEVEIKNCPKLKHGYLYRIKRNKRKTL